MGLGYGTFVSCAQTVAIQQPDPAHLGLATSTFFFCMDLANGLGPSLLGAVAAAAGYRVLYLAMAVVALASAALYYVAHGRRAA